MSDQPHPKASFATFLGTVQGKIITALTVVALLLGIAAEGVSLVTGYYNMVIARQKAAAATARGATPSAETLATIKCDPQKGPPDDYRPHNPNRKDLFILDLDASQDKNMRQGKPAGCTAIAGAAGTPEP